MQRCRLWQGKQTYNIFLLAKVVQISGRIRKSLQSFQNEQDMFFTFLNDTVMCLLHDPRERFFLPWDVFSS